MCFRGNVSGHDFQFHLASWMDVAGQWREGIAYPRWAEWANWGFGEPRFVFYPPVSWMAGAALSFVLPWKMVPGAFIWLSMVVAGMSMWRLARDWIAGPCAVVAAVLFAVNPYHLVIAYYRSDFAELLADALLPLLIWAFLGVAREGWRRVPWLAVIFAGIWLSNAPAAVIATYALGLMLLIVCAVQRSFRPLVPGATAMASGFGLVAFYILPAAWEQRWVQIGQVVGENLRPAQNFLFTRANDPEFVAFNWKVSWVAIAVMIVTGIAATFAARRRRDFRELWWILAVLGAVAAALMFGPSLFLWRSLPELNFIQFPWRWLSMLDLALAFFVAAAMSRAQKIASWLGIAIVFAALLAAGRAMVEDAWWDSSDVPAMAEGIRSGRGYEGTNEYAPVGCDRWEFPGDPDDDARPADVSPVPAPPIGKIDLATDTLVPATGVRLHVARWTAERKVFTVETPAPVTLALRLVSYPGWEVRVDGKQTRGELRADTNQLLLPLGPGAHRVEARFGRTWDRTAGDAISVLSAMAWLGLVAVLRKRGSGEPAR